jgi:C4-dicarboxylate transporter DctQ subunit
MKLLNAIEEWIITLLIGAATVITFLAVIHRYGSGFAIPVVQDWLISIDMTWAQELTIILFVWMAKFGAAYGVRTGIHVGVDVLINKLSPNNRFKFIVFGLLAGALFTGIIASVGGKFVWENGAHYSVFNAMGFGTEGVLEGPVTVDLEWPTWVVYAAIPLGSGLMCFRFLQVCWSFIKTGELPHHDESHVEGVDAESGDWADAPDPSPVHPLDLRDSGRQPGAQK